MRIGFLHSKVAVFTAITALALIAGGNMASAQVKASKDAAKEKAESKAKPYPLETCVVADEKLGSMGDPYVFVHEGQELKLCCKGCLKSFKKEPAKYLKKLDKPAAKKS